MRELAKLIKSIFKTERILLDRYPILQNNTINDINKLMDVLSNKNIFLVEKINVENVIIDPKPSNIIKNNDNSVMLVYTNNTPNTISFNLKYTITNAVAFNMKNVILIFIPKQPPNVILVNINVHGDIEQQHYYTYYSNLFPFPLKTPINSIEIIYTYPIYIFGGWTIQVPFSNIFFLFEPI